MATRKSSFLAGAIAATAVAGVAASQTPDSATPTEPSVAEAIELAQRTAAEEAPRVVRDRDRLTAGRRLAEAVRPPDTVRLVGNPNLRVSPAAAEIIQGLANDAAFPIPDDFELWVEFCLLCSERPSLSQDELVQYGRTVVVQ